jgi:hypothetical protein
MKLVADIVITGILNGAKPLSKLLALRGRQLDIAYIMI